MRKLLATLLLCVGLNTAHSQDLQLPEQVQLETKEDYSKYEQDIIKVAKWLETTPVMKNDERRTQANAFVVKWLTGSPTVLMEVRPVMMQLVDKNPQLMVVFMASYARWVLENNYAKDEEKAYLAATRSIIHCYNLGGRSKEEQSTYQGCRG